MNGKSLSAEGKVALLFVRDLSKTNHNQIYAVQNGKLSNISAEQLTVFHGIVICHDFWAIRDAIFGKTDTLPNAIVDLEEFRMSTSRIPSFSGHPFCEKV